MLLYPPGRGEAPVENRRPDVKQEVIVEENREVMQTNEETKESRTYTQEEVEHIVQKRLARERLRNERESTASDADREKALGERELKVLAKEKLLDEGMPSTLADMLKYDDEESLDAAISAMKKLNQEKESSGAWGMRVSGGKSKPPRDQFRQAMGLDRKG